MGTWGIYSKATGGHMYLSEVVSSGGYFLSVCLVPAPLPHAGHRPSPSVCCECCSVLGEAGGGGPCLWRSPYRALSLAGLPTC